MEKLLQDLSDELFFLNDDIELTQAEVARHKAYLEKQVARRKLLQRVQAALNAGEVNV